MPTYQVTYFNAKHAVMDSEAIFMKSLTNANAQLSIMRQRVQY
ncbi:hypothetical protein P3383_23400 [Vibrio parahaemolyticus]|nr:hypothetical protein [Vibrio parahaemolyticus]